MSDSIRNRLLIPFASASVALLITIGGFGCLVSGFSLDADLLGLFLCCAAAAAVSGALCLVSWGWLLLLILGAFSLGYAWQKARLILELESLLNQITALIDSGYGWGVVSWTGDNLSGVPIQGILLWLASAMTVIMTLQITTNTGTFLQVSFGVLPLLPCLLLMDTTPGKFWLFLLALGVMLLILTGKLRKRDQTAGLKQIFRITVPVLLAILLLFSLGESTAYQASLSMQESRDRLLEELENLQNLAEDPDIPFSEPPTSLNSQPDVDLSKMGANPETGEAVMRVSAEYNETLYLRGNVYGVYTGTSWDITSTRDLKKIDDPDTWGWGIPDRYLARGESITITTYQEADMLFLPYTVSSESLSDARGDFSVPNRQGVTSYTVERMVTIPGESLSCMVLSDELAEIYCQLPDSTHREALESHLDKALANTDPGDPTAVANAIGSYVRASAYYDLEPPRMRGDDFALWFLEEADRGYCVHFATTAAVLLRAAGIPARFVTGYLVEARADRFVQVTTDEAHAWVEYFVEGQGWQVLEATPGLGNQPIPPDAPTQVTELPQEETLPSTVETRPDTPSSDPGAPTVPGAQEDDPVPDRPRDPSQQGDDPEQDETTPPDLTWLWYPAAMAAAAGLLVLRRELILRRRARKMLRRRPNRLALFRWQYLERLSKYTKQPPDEAVRGIAQKAKFSQHTISEEELAALEESIAAQQALLQAMPLHRRLYWQWILVLY
ncbi:MAG: transglutaminaseTgpA domain-containing protein [Faecousia sp.]